MTKLGLGLFNYCGSVIAVESEGEFYLLLKDHDDPDYDNPVVKETKLGEVAKISKELYEMIKKEFSR